MRWKQGRRSGNVEDRRGRAASRGLPIGGAGLLAVVVLAWLAGADPGQLLMLLAEGEGPAGVPSTSPSQPRGAADDELADFVSVVLASTEDAWSSVFRAAGSEYRPPALVLYTDATPTACGYGSAATGPFYCPADETIYLDLAFLGELRRLGAPGDFAFAYVIGHEVGHHVQKITGTEPRVRDLQRGSSRAEANALSVRMELQADCYAGLWAHHTDRAGVVVLEEGDVEEGLAAAAAIGDDRLQRSAGREVQPETFTHGTSRQRTSWLRAGLQGGDVGACDTFAAR